MILTNYWWMLIWILGGGVLAIFVPKQQELVKGKKVERWTMPAALILILPYILWAGFRSDNFGDTGHTSEHFGNVRLRLAKLETIFQLLQKIKAFIF